MKRVAKQTPPWLVVPVSVLGTALLLILAQWALDSDDTSGRVNHGSPISASDPDQRGESRADESASGLLAGPLLPSGVEQPTQDLPPGMGDISAAVANDRPAAFPPTDQVVHNPRVVEPLARYGANVTARDLRPAVAPVGETDEPVRARSIELVDQMFQPPAMPLGSARESWSPERQQLPAQAVEPTRVGSVEESEPVLMRLPPVEPVTEPLEIPLIAQLDTPSQSLAAESEAALMRLPPVEPIAEPLEIPSIAELDGASKPLAAESEAVLMRLPPVEPVMEPLEIPSIAELDGASKPHAAESEAALMRLPPVEPTTEPLEIPLIAQLDTSSQPLAAESEAALTRLPPVEPITEPIEGASAVPLDTSAEPPAAEPEAASTPHWPVESSQEGRVELPAIALVEGLFQRSAPVSESRSTLPVPVVPIEEELEAVVQPLPAVEREATRDVSEAVEATAADGPSFDPQDYERSWNLELIVRQADKHSRNGFELANKKAFFSARLEFTRALRVTAQGLDTERGTNRHSRALAAGLRAMAEAEDFMPKGGHLEAELDLALIAGGHRTPLLREGEVNGLTPLAAMQQYYTYAQEQLAAAVGKEMAGSMALCGLGKLHVVIGDEHRVDGISSTQAKAMVLYQAALLAAPANHMASNELGVLLARNGRYGEARQAFEHSVAVHPTAQACRNLALTCEQLGLMDEGYQAARQALALRGKSDVPSSTTLVSGYGAVRWVPPAAFAKEVGKRRATSGGGASAEESATWSTMRRPASSAR